jgi:hypothetical protein
MKNDNSSKKAFDYFVKIRLKNSRSFFQKVFLKPNKSDLTQHPTTPQSILSSPNNSQVHLS